VIQAGECRCEALRAAYIQVCVANLHTMRAVRAGDILALNVLILQRCVGCSVGSRKEGQVRSL